MSYGVNLDYLYVTFHQPLYPNTHTNTNLDLQFIVWNVGHHTHDGLYVKMHSRAPHGPPLHGTRTYTKAVGTRFPDKLREAGGTNFTIEIVALVK